MWSVRGPGKPVLKLGERCERTGLGLNVDLPRKAGSNDKQGGQITKWSPCQMNQNLLIRL